MPLLMDLENEGLPHYRVCTKKNTPEEIKANILEFYVKRVEWKKERGYAITAEDRLRAQMEVPDDAEAETEKDKEKNDKMPLSLDKIAAPGPTPLLSQSPKKTSETLEQYIMRKNDENWQIILEQNVVLAQHIQSLRNELRATNALQRTIMRHLGIPDT